jgi:hypothetical protein
MCMICCSIAAAVVIVFFGYMALWSASQANTPAGISSFGRVMAIILFVIAGFILISGIACRRGACGPMMMGKMGGWGNASMMPAPGCHMPGMMQPGDEKGRPGMPPPEGKKAEPVKK